MVSQDHLAKHMAGSSQLKKKSTEILGHFQLYCSRINPTKIDFLAQLAETTPNSESGALKCISLVHMFNSLLGVLGSSKAVNGLPREQLGPLNPVWVHEVVMGTSYYCFHC